jgi:predicted HNH restriction endonuclease
MCIEKECLHLDLIEYVKQYKNNNYDLITDNGTSINTEKINRIDLAYITKLTSVSNFWKENNSKYKDLSIAAGIVLGKPTHNAFQERVFSRGTYTDTSLKKRLKETSFEMSVLNAVNICSMDKIKEQIDIINNGFEEDIADFKINTNKYSRVREYYDKKKEQQGMHSVEDQGNINYESDDDTENKSVVEMEETMSSDDDDSDDASISKYFEGYEQQKQINELNELNDKQNNLSTIYDDKMDMEGSDDTDDGNKKTKSEGQY